MEQRGKGPANGNWKSFGRCPYCEGQGCAGVFDAGHGDLFKCHRTSCKSGTAPEGTAWDEIGFLAYEMGVSRRDASILYLKEAGVWQEERLGPSVLPGSSKRRVRNSRFQVSGEKESSEEWVDPRREELFALIDSLKKQ
jgi:hypothetical protein